MKEYKRLTIKNSDGTYSQPTDLTFEKAFYRLAELEDKLENGTLIELPCKVWDKVYVVNGKDEIEEVVVINYSANKLGFDFEVVSKDTNEQYYLFDFDFNKDWFLTKAEAEAKLKELKEV